MITAFEGILMVIYFISLYFSIFWLTVYLTEGSPKKRTLRKFPKVSIIIPVYNEEKNIRKSIESILNLSYPRDKLELIIVDDGSKDNTSKIAREYVNKYPSQVVLINQVNKGKGAALNNAIKKAKGEFVACLDADSTVAKSSLKEMLVYFTHNNIAAVTPMMKIRNTKTILQSLQKYEYIISLFMKRLMSYLDCIYVTPGPFSIYRKEVLKKIGYFAEDSLTEDMEIAYRLQKHQYKIKQCMVGGFSYTVGEKNIKGLYKQRNRWYKGSLINLYQYRGMLFNKDYGHFGVLQMPRNIYGFLAASLFIYTFFYYLLWPLLQKINTLFIINFNILPYITSLSYLNLISISIPKLFIIVPLTLIGFLFIIGAHIYAKERFTGKSVFFYLPLLLLFYPLLISFIYIIVVGETIAGKRQKW